MIKDRIKELRNELDTIDVEELEKYKLELKRLNNMINMCLFEIGERT